MENFEPIEEKIKNMENEQICKVKGKLLFSSGYYIYEPTKQKLKKYKVYLDPTDAKKIMAFINSKDFSGIKGMKPVGNSGKMLEARGTKDGAIVLFQLLEYAQIFVPASPVVVLRGNDAQLMLEFVKS